MTEKTFIPSPQQNDFLTWAETGTGSCVLEAVAGAGKTTTIIHAVTRFSGNVALLAFNKKIANELADRLKSAGIDWKKAQAGTVHSFGFSAFRKSFPNVKVDGDKVSNLIDELFRTHPQTQAQFGAFRSDVAKLVSMGKQTGAGFLWKVEDRSQWLEIIDKHDLFDVEGEEETPVDLNRLIDMAVYLLRQSSKMVDVIDFDDMIYLPLLLRCRFWQYDVVMIDEAQDTNPVRRALVGAILRKGGRVVAVGDRHQAIYGFTGADADALDLIAKDFACVRLPLTTTYRCPKTVVSFAQQWVSHIHAAETAPEGAVRTITMEEFKKRNDLDGESAVLCRVTRPLVSLAFQLIRNKIPCRVEGRDFATGLKKLATRWKVKTLSSLETRLEVFLESQRVKLLAKKQEVRFQTIEDQVETLRVIIDQVRSENKDRLDDVVKAIDDLFGDDISDLLVLSTIHKAKGREWNRVFWYDRAGTCPSKWARQAWQKEQEVNLQYVAATRAKEELYDLLK